LIVFHFGPFLGKTIQEPGPFIIDKSVHDSRFGDIAYLVLIGSPAAGDFA